MIQKLPDHDTADAATERAALERAVALSCSYFDALTPLKSARPQIVETEPATTFFIDDYRIDLPGVGHLIRGRAAA